MTGRPPPRPPGPPRPVLEPGQLPVRGALPTRPRPPPPRIGDLRQMMAGGPGPSTRPLLCPPGIRLPPPMPIGVARATRPISPAPRSLGRGMMPAERPMPPTAGTFQVSAPAVRPSTQEPIASTSFATGPLEQSLPSVQNEPLELHSGPVTYQGSGGSCVQMTANFLRLSVEDSTEVSEYEVLFTPQVDDRNERFRLLATILPTEIGINKVFDGVKLFLPKPLDPLTREFPARLSSGSDVKVKLLYKRRFNFKDRDAVQLLNILFNRIMRTLKLIQHKRNFYNPAATTNIPNCNLQVWPGYVTAIDLYEGGILLQCDVSHRILRTDTALSVFAKLRRNQDTSRFIEEAKKFFIGTSVLTRYNNKTYIIDDIDFDSSPNSTFVQANGEEISFGDYYMKQYGMNIVDKNQPMLVHRPKKKFKRGDMTEGDDDPERVILLVPELCLLTGMTDEMRSDFRIMRELSNVTRQDPSKRQTEVREFVRTVLSNPEALAHLTTWGIGLTDEPLPVPARILPAEKLNFGRNFVEAVNSKGDWTRAATSQMVLTAIHIRNWVVFYPANCEADVQKFCQALEKNAKKMGIEIARPRLKSLPNDRTETFITEMKKVVEPGDQIVMTVFPQLRGDRYSAVKKHCCIDKPIASQCILLKTIKGDDRKTNSVAQKVVLQMNCKLGGELWSSPIPIDTLMVIGIDVWHSKTQDSIAGVVASFNATLTRYYSETSVQKNNEELFLRLSNPIRHAFAAYFNNNNFKFPEHVVVFRDGVGDGQLSAVEKHEATRFMSIIYEMVHALNERNEKRDEPAHNLDNFMLGPPDLPPVKVPSLVYVVVQKRINTRIYNYTPGTNVYSNPPPGTIVDSTITRYQYKDFFLVPQSVTQGTVSPTHFVVVKEYGEKYLKPAIIQKLAYKLTHMYYNWPGTVRVPAPCQYAHKLVHLVGENLRSPVTNEDLNRKLFYL